MSIQTIGSANTLVSQQASQQPESIKPNPENKLQPNPGLEIRDNFLATLATGVSSFMNLKTYPALTEAITSNQQILSEAQTSIATHNTTMSTLKTEITALQAQLKGADHATTKTLTRQIESKSEAYLRAVKEKAKIEPTTRGPQSKLNSALAQQRKHQITSGTLAGIGAGLHGYLAFQGFHDGNYISGAGNTVAAAGNLMLATSAFTGRMPALKKPALVMAIGGAFLGMAGSIGQSVTQKVGE